MAEALQFEKEDEDGNPIQHSATARSSRKPRPAKKKRTSTASMVASSDGDDDDFEVMLESGSSDDAGSCDKDILPLNTEVITPAADYHYFSFL
jgi:hypothetical protein